MANLQQVHRGSVEKPVIILVHGLGGHPVDTWRHHGCKADDCWPHWIGQDTGCDTWVLEYDAELSAWRDQAMPLPDQGDQILDLLDVQKELRGRELVLIGHSLGGLVIKTLVVRGRSRGFERFEAVVGRVRGVVFIATPHEGAHLATLALAARWVLRTNVHLGNMKAHDPHLRQLHEEFRHALTELACDVHPLAERRGVRIGPRILGWHIGWRVMVVNASSGDPALPGIPTVPMAGDHFSICKPKDRTEHIHRSVCDFVERVQKGASRRARSAAPTPLAATAPPDQPGRLTGPDDNRLQPREHRVYGRESEIADVMSFLQRSDGPVAASVVGVGGTGKTEVCKAALKTWLARSRDVVAYYIPLGDSATAAELIAGLANALGAGPIETAAQLLSIVPAGTYYVDNVETVLEQSAGKELFRALTSRPGVRLLTSSRTKAPTILGRPIEVEALPENEALALFRDSWTGKDALPANAVLREFVVGELGAHALSVTLTARLGDSYSYSSLVTRWSIVGTDLPRDFEDESRLGSLSVSLCLTAGTLSTRKGALELWTAAALFPSGIPDQLLARLEEEGDWSEARPALVRHNLLTRRNDHWHMLPPVARLALDLSARGQAGFDWASCRKPIRAIFDGPVSLSGRIDSTEESLAARRWVVGNFEALTRLIRQELSSTSPDLDWLQNCHDHLLNVYLLTIARSLELLPLLIDKLEAPASAFKALGVLKSQSGDPEAARALFDQALRMYERLGSIQGQAEIVRFIAELESRLGRIEAARTSYNRALALFEKARQDHGQANVLLRVGDMELQIGRLDAARELLGRALTLFERRRDGIGQANTLYVLGKVEYRCDEPEKARTLYYRALALFEKEQNNLGQANVLQGLGDVERKIGRRETARAWLDRALALFEQEQVALGQANTLQSIGDLLRAGLDFTGAAVFYERAVALYARQQEPMGTAYTFAELARCHHASGDERQRDQALLNAFAASSREEVRRVTDYVVNVLIEVTGSSEAARQWRTRYNVE